MIRVGGIGGLVSIREEGGRTLLPVDDGLGNITAVIDQITGEVVARYDYGPYGEIIGESGEVEACPFRYQSKWWDGNGGGRWCAGAAGRVAHPGSSRRCAVVSFTGSLKVL